VVGFKPQSSHLERGVLVRGAWLRSDRTKKYVSSKFRRNWGLCGRVGVFVGDLVLSQAGGVDYWV